jgi:hypothetical protein
MATRARPLGVMGAATTTTTTHHVTVIPPGSTSLSRSIPPPSANSFIGYPSAPSAGAPLYVSASLPPLQYHPVESGDPAYVPYLPDLSGGWIDLAGANPSANSYKPTTIIERVPSLPFFPGSFGLPWPSLYGDQMAGIAKFISLYKPKPIAQSMLRYASGWNRLPHPSPVYVAIQGFGVGVALYWCTSLIPLLANKPPVVMYAVLKLAPLPVSAVDAAYVGNFYKVFASACKPMKYAISQFPTQSSADAYNCVFVVDTGEEFRIPLDVVRQLYNKDVRIRIAVNAFVRDYPFTENQFAFVPALPPPEIQIAIANYGKLVQGYQSTLAGQSPTYVATMPGAALNYPNNVVIRPAPPPQSKGGDDDKEEEEKEEKKEEGAEEEGAESEDGETPETKPTEAMINLSTNSVTLTPWKM